MAFAYFFLYFRIRNYGHSFLWLLYNENNIRRSKYDHHLLITNQLLQIFLEPTKNERFCWFYVLEPVFQFGQQRLPIFFLVTLFFRIRMREKSVLSREWTKVDLLLLRTFSKHSRYFRFLLISWWKRLQKVPIN